MFRIVNDILEYKYIPIAKLLDNVSPVIYDLILDEMNSLNHRETITYLESKINNEEDNYAELKGQYDSLSNSFERFKDRLDNLVRNGY